MKLFLSAAPGRAVDTDRFAGIVPPDGFRFWRASTLGRITDRLERRLLLELAGELRGRTFLDVGCGDGALLVWAAARGAHATGVDPSRAMVEAARERARAEGAAVSVRLGSGENLPFADGSFHLVAAVTALCFVRDPDAVVREMARVLAPGGRLVIGELGRWSVWAARRRIRGWLGDEFWQKARFRTADELCRLLENGGLAVKRVAGAVYYPPWGWAARIFEPIDPWLGRLGSVGAAFLAIAADREERECPIEGRTSFPIAEPRQRLGESPA